MPETRIDSAVASNLTNAVDDFEVGARTTDGATGTAETEWLNNHWPRYLGYYKEIPELKAVIDAKATWTVGKGFRADEITTFTLDLLKGFGKDTFNTIIENMIRTYNIGGDAFCEIIRDEDKNIINLKPLDPWTIKIVADKKGIIKRYEQIAKSDRKKTTRSFQPEELFHLARNRVADEIHGISLVEVLEKIILMRNEAMTDMKELMHRYVRPKFIFHLDTDDTTEIKKFKATNDALTNTGDNLYVPKDAVVPELMAVAANATLNPLPWIENLNNQFFQVSGVPQIILGGSAEFTEATAKIAYLAFQQSIEEEQLYIEEQVGQQLGMRIELTFPASLENELLSDNAKDKETGATQPNDTTAG